MWLPLSYMLSYKRPLIHTPKINLSKLTGSPSWTLVISLLWLAFHSPSGVNRHLLMSPPEKCHSKAETENQVSFHTHRSQQCHPVGPEAPSRPLNPSFSAPSSLGPVFYRLQHDKNKSSCRGRNTLSVSLKEASRKNTVASSPNVHRGNIKTKRWKHGGRNKMSGLCPYPQINKATWDGLVDQNIGLQLHLFWSTCH